MSDTNPPADHVFVDEKEPGKMEQNVKSRSTWTRFLFMVICCIFVWLATMVGAVVVVLGFLMVLFTGEVIDAATAKEIGLVSRCVPHDELMPTAMALAEKIAKNPPLAVRAGRA